MVNAMNSIESRKNDLKSFKSYLEEKLAEEGEDSLADALSGVQYTYNFDLNVYTKNVDGDIIHSDMRELIAEYNDKIFRREHGDVVDWQQLDVVGYADRIFGRLGFRHMAGDAARTRRESLSTRCSKNSTI